MVRNLGRATQAVAPGGAGMIFRPALFVGIILVAIAPHAWSQQAASASSSESTATLEEIVVTAEKRTETVQSTPLSVTAYSGAQLIAAGLSGMSQVGYETPGVSERNSGPGQTEYEMRGVASSGGQSPTVGFYLDDTPLSAPEEALLGKVVIDPTLYDLNRVEVLRGPQGTLYGSGSMGGTIKLVTNQPDPTAFAASAQTILSGTEDGGFNYGVNAMVNIPLVDDKLALRVVGSDTYDDGWIDRKVLDPFPLPSNGGFTRGDVTSAPVVADHKDSNWERVQGVRTALQWLPVDGLTITPSIFIQTIKSGAPNFVDAPPGVKSETHYQPYDVNEPYTDGFQLFSLPIKYELPGVEVSSSSAYYRRQTHLNQDDSEVVQDFLEGLIGIPGVTYADVGPVTAFETDYTSQFTEEVRLTSTGSGPFQWLVGGFYQDYKAQTGIGLTTNIPYVQQFFGAPSLFDLTFNNQIKQYAGFGEASYNFLGNFKLTAGLRYYSYNSTEHLVQGGGLIVGPGLPEVLSLPASADGVNPKVNLSYEPTKDLTLYVQAAKGFRPGGGNPSPPITCPSNPLQFSPDGIWSYEAGEKLRMFDDRITVNGALYYENWTGIQQLVTETCGATYVANAGTAHIYGGELELNARLTTQLTLTSGTAYTHAYVVSALAGTGFTDGERVQEVPDWTNTTSLVYRQPVTDDYAMVLRATNVYIGTMTDVSFVLNQVPAHDLVNLRAGLISDRKVSVSLFVNNVTDKRANLGDPEEISFFVPSLNRVTTNQPRTIGVELNYAWGGQPRP